MFFRSDGKVFCIRDQREMERRHCEKCPESLDYEQDWTGVFNRCRLIKELTLSMISLNRKFEKGKKTRQENIQQKTI
jgi:hypothetical protein